MKKLTRADLKNVMGGTVDLTQNLDDGAPGCVDQGDVCRNKLGQILQCCSGLFCETDRTGVLPLCQSISGN